jgi:hypothetical protein
MVSDAHGDSRYQPAVRLRNNPLTSAVSPFMWADEKKKKSTIFSIHVHPDCSRLATGSLGELSLK